MNIQEQITGLSKALPKLSDKDRTFASSLIKQWIMNNMLSDKQLVWVAKLTDRATAPAPVMEQDDLGDFGGVYELLQTATASLKFPKVRLQTEDGQPVVLSILGPRSKFAGDINVTDGGPFGQGKWFGRIDGAGKWTKSHTAKDAHEVGNVLRTLGNAPVETAAAHGKLTGSCCFCARHLEADGSLEVGYGPTCAKHYGLPWGSK